MNYDPNLISCGRMADQTVKLTFGCWEFRAEMTVVVGGNCCGLDVIKSALRIAYDILPSRKFRLCGKETFNEASHIILKNAAGDELECEDEEEDYEDWLAEMLIGAEIVAIEPQKEEPK